jgi:hypothetical protein
MYSNSVPFLLNLIKKINEVRGLGNGKEQKNKKYRWLLFLKKESRPVQVNFEKPEEKENT